MSTYAIESAVAGPALRRSDAVHRAAVRRVGILATSVFLAAVTILAFGSDPARGNPNPSINGGSAMQRAEVAEVMAAYRRAGLTLPRVVVTFGAPGQCAGAQGRYDGQGNIKVCSPGPAHDRHVIAHELAHAWLDAELDGQRRRAFLALRRLATWGDASVRWDERGKEQAAEVLTWAVLRHPLLLVRFGGKSCAGLAKGYETLTGKEPVPAATGCPIH